MTVNEVVEDLKEYAAMGYGDRPLLWMNLNIQEHVEVEEELHCLMEAQ